jgi:hypothetical protein
VCHALKNGEWIKTTFQGVNVRMDTIECTYRYYYTLGKKVRVYVLRYCPLGQRLVNVHMGGSPAICVTPEN